MSLGDYISTFMRRHRAYLNEAEEQTSDLLNALEQIKELTRQIPCTVVTPCLTCEVHKIAREAVDKVNAIRQPKVEVV